MQGRMCWLSKDGEDEEKILHLQTEISQGWRPYTAFPQFAAPDHALLGASKGLATFQKLLKAGWTVVPSNNPQVGWVEALRNPTPTSSIC